ncbi:MAG TPA: diguanylate cyclase [Spirochaetia bacterium]|nr:MAG: hypothetical protein A2Y41_09505 [Spirochaetes bacterium GWB1_36_13]HCL56379.1 diguanylate cyclase [Spirochaetia bacterium]
MIQAKQWEELIHLGIDLSTYKTLKKLLKKIALESIKLMNCQGASIYIKNGHQIDFMITQNTVLEKKLGNLEDIFKIFSLPISNESIAGYAALKKETLNIPDVYQIKKDNPYRFFNNIDVIYQYKTESMLTMPMLDTNQNLVGVLQFINRQNDENEIKSFSKGDEFIGKYLSSISAIAIKNASFDQLLKESYHETVYRLAVASEFRDLETSLHIQRIGEYSSLLWKKMGNSSEDAEIIKYASQMHDIGKIGIPDRILQKPGPLTADERKIMENHTLIGGKILENSNSSLIHLSQSVALSHHEKWDGTGYPNKLKGEEIPLIGRVVALTDVFDALSSKRVYKPAFGIDKVISIIKEERGKHFDPKILNSFLDTLPQILEIYEKYKE